MLYFAYGSNMSLPRLLARLPEVNFLGSAVLEQYQLRFHKKGTDGSAKGNALYTGHDTDYMYGVLYELAPHLKHRLDAIEDAGVGYETVPVTVRDQFGRKRRACTYVALQIDCSLQPFDWYLTHVLYGAQAAGLPQEYIEQIRAYPTVSDANDLRRAREQRLYRQSDLDHLLHFKSMPVVQHHCL
ncbi:gamma-glutamylcyclotransferase family protein [Pontibacter sp. JAM-7]|uniref:gamma-glutamylcyclotransferase family protein n=1 Tax=Pontibacter sp. JAM-7 TaxID=3366581 RepID=UPI003AF60629